ncbi:MAG TPA: biotin--[acetyl-CoA-carboxylase] ligase [Pyrinomonadaceae bacterium]|nr:biotin--[acetyl-CoA-carboxylase] ligase [Pyrinomonadaceae bacterium]
MAFNPTILRFESLPSTNLEAARRATEGAPEGLCVVAAEQTSGRGRLGRQWLSPKGAGLYFSVVLRPTLPHSSWPLLTLMTAVAVHDALLESCGLQTDIKWPNDIVAGEKKLCGILAETVETAGGSAVVMGIGINLTEHSFPPQLQSVATSIQGISGLSVDYELVLQSLVKNLATQYEKFQTNPAGSLAKDWCARSSYCQGKRIRVTDGNGTFEGVTKGLETDGGLVVELDNGAQKVIRAADISSVRSTETVTQ